ncbi:glycosyltransferase family 2 protein [Loigolactobacillus zhaoyuanensis]|uniref:Glycosyltransferase family 2 protein n=2 Tax=Loigolactobacillus zhaoyuanensis TaxID=2486017 RepID=A0ABW8UEV5_9LACO
MFLAYIGAILKKTHVGDYIIKNKILARLFMKGIDCKNIPKLEESRNILNETSPLPIGTSIVSNRNKNIMQYDLKIIIPVYNVEKYIAECLKSVIDQDCRYKIKIQIINDGSTDNSLARLSPYLDDEKVSLISQKNKGFSAARNKGLETLDSKYIMFLDSDDTLEPNSIELLLDKAFADNADIVEGSFNYITKNGRTKGIVHKDLNNVSSELLIGYPWGKVIRATLFSRVQFPLDFWYEDSIISYLIYSLSSNNSTISNSVYNYRYNSSGISVTSKQNPKCVDTFWITELMLDELGALKLPKTDRIVNLFFSQVILNFRRTRYMSDEVKKAIFVQTIYLIKRKFKNCEPSKKFDELYNSLLRKDYKAYYMLCTFL